jgi:hypothetical protein
VVEKDIVTSSPGYASGFKKNIRAQDVSGDEGLRSQDRTVHMGLSGEMHDGIGPILCEHFIEGFPITNVRLFEIIAAFGLGTIAEGDLDIRKPRPATRVTQ